ncbi:LytTR family DNA-binding domain-containing protein [Cytophagaceae bacterium DM2B3-1]|uniref:LytTR family DNA-binding domain-containing protein n=1 Tax=Xanthocytophaga flava TaxID=3048013 RepID=A0ABT7CTF5_9BACT|nr:LytTR family DNA-binding domain-containing protein [Xanthocytophaga flavus]MDJ1472223.1 LytTR family DNA-binding domain-containing protein [Xanthocytophaga flavus]MDJ1497007.1 LytTR family DNA-binding domain-containing protein [Xanthocytophaga flavus]
MNCIIVDDDEMSRAIVKHFVEQTQFLNLVGICTDAIQAANTLQTTAVDLIFLDVEMPEMTGMELVKSLTSKPQVVIISSRADYAVEAFEYSIADYLVKPISYARFLKAVEKVRDSFDAQSGGNGQSQDLYIKTDAKIVKITLKELLYVEALADYVILHTATARYIVHSTMKGIEKKLSDGSFARIHRSYIINTEKIESIEDLSVVINKKYIPIGASYKDTFLKRLNIL